MISLLYNVTDFMHDILAVKFPGNLFRFTVPSPDVIHAQLAPLNVECVEDVALLYIFLILFIYLFIFFFRFPIRC